MFLDIICKKKIQRHALNHSLLLALHGPVWSHHSGRELIHVKSISQCFCVKVVLDVSVVLLVKTLLIASMLDQFCLQSESPFSFSSVSLRHSRSMKMAPTTFNVIFQINYTQRWSCFTAKCHVHQWQTSAGATLLAFNFNYTTPQPTWSQNPASTKRPLKKMAI